MSTHTKSRRYAAWIMSAVCLAFLLTPAAPASAKEWDSDKHNVILVIPEDPGPWAWMPDSAEWKTRGIVKGARRTLDTLKSGEKATVEGGILHLYELDLDEGKTLKDMESDDKIRSLLLKRFEGGDSAPKVDREETKLNDDLPAVIITAEGQARNRLGEMSRALGRMLLTTARGKLYLLRMYVWTTEHDDEGLKYDLDYIETNFMIKETKEKAKKPDKPVKKPDGDGEGEGEDEGKEEEIQLREHQLRMTKHKKLTQKETSDDSMLLFFEESDRGGWYQIVLYATKNGRVVNGQTAPDMDIKSWLTTQWWKNFTANHPEGELWTFRWPKRIKAPTFITLPDLSVEEQKVVTKPKRRPIDPKASDIIKKLKLVEKVKKKNLGKKFKVIEPWRGIIKGNRPRYGDETVLRFAWRTAFFSFRLIVTVGGEGYKKWGEAIRSTLESIHHYK